MLQTFPHFLKSNFQITLTRWSMDLIFYSWRTFRSCSLNCSFFLFPFVLFHIKIYTDFQYRFQREDTSIYGMEQTKLFKILVRITSWIGKNSYNKDEWQLKSSAEMKISFSNFFWITDWKMTQELNTRKQKKSKEFRI